MDAPPFLGCPILAAAGPPIGDDREQKVATRCPVLHDTVPSRWRRSPRHDTEREIPVDWKLELVAVPVSDVDRAKSFYTEKVGFHADHAQRVSDTMRFVQLTPPGSACSIAFGEGIVQSVPGSVEGLQLVVSDVAAARAELVERGVEVSEVQDFPWGSFVFFSDPDGNGWAVQQVPARS